MSEQTILIVEDETSLLKALAEKFEAEKYKVLTAKDGEEALKKTQEEMEGDEGESDIGEDIADDINKFADDTCLYRETTTSENIIQIGPTSGWEKKVADFETEGRKITGYTGTKLKRLFISSRAPVWNRNMKSGKLDCLNLWKTKIG